ncbi:histidine kinase dimerization/phosphoacceptor domain -containing protein [Polaribacter uvawellassae]|uniref:histidine kinase dimerization/phosphoacceptor domain -containing protein n=1 Tax=Polaribacter uvawellassae TaxID=3133495 RepID=UPI003218ECBC
MNSFKKIIPFLLIGFTSFAQQKNADSVATSFSNKAWNYFEVQNDSALYFADKGIEYSKKNKSTIGEILNLEIKGIYLEEVKNEYSKASENYFKAIEIAEKYQQKHVSSLYNNLCIMYIATKDYKKAELYGKKATATSKYIKGTRAEAKAYVNLGIAQSLLKKYNEANTTFNYFLSLKILSQFERNIANLRIAKNYTEQKKYNKAQPLLLKVVAPDSLKGQRNYNLDYSELIKNSIQLKDKKTILKYLAAFKNSFKDEKSLEYLDSFYETMVKVSVFLNKTNDAFLYQQKSLELKDSLNSKKYNKQIAELETQYQTKKKEAQIIIEKNKRMLWVYISVFAFISLLFVAILLQKNSKKRKQLKQNKIELENLLNQRNMLLRETHHRVKNSFQMVSSLLQLQAQGSKAESAIKALENAVQRVNSMIVLHQQLYAKDNLLGVNLKIYVTDLVQEILTSYASEKLNIKQVVSPIIVDVETATSIGLLINELATNSIKHAWKSSDTNKKISIDIFEKDNTIHFKMFDNGIENTSKLTQNYGSELIDILIDRLDAEKQSFSENQFSLYLTFLISEINA